MSALIRAVSPSNILLIYRFFFFFFQAEDGIRDYKVTGVQTCALPISSRLCRYRGLPAASHPVSPANSRGAGLRPNLPFPAPRAATATVPRRAEAGPRSVRAARPALRGSAFPRAGAPPQSSNARDAIRRPLPSPARATDRAGRIAAVSAPHVLQEDSRDPGPCPVRPPPRRVSQRGQIGPRRTPVSPPAPLRALFHPAVVHEKRAHAKEA